jgi:uncharacterized membrane protein
MPKKVVRMRDSKGRFMTTAKKLTKTKTKQIKRNKITKKKLTAKKRKLIKEMKGGNTEGTVLGGLVGYVATGGILGTAAGAAIGHYASK